MDHTDKCKKKTPVCQFQTNTGTFTSTSNDSGTFIYVIMVGNWKWAIVDLTFIHTTTFIMLSIFSQAATVSLKTWKRPLSWHVKFSLSVSICGSNIRVRVSLHEFTEQVSLVSSLNSSQLTWLGLTWPYHFCIGLMVWHSCGQCLRKTDYSSSMFLHSFFKGLEFGWRFMLNDADRSSRCCDLLEFDLWQSQGHQWLFGPQS